MGEEPAPQKTTTTTMWAAVCTLVLLVYLLSPGLLVAASIRWGWKSNETMEKAVSIAYSPIGLLVKWHPAAEFYAWYFSLCSGRDVKIPP
ncbi:hypothetical protein DES53_105133 [Roseimicrobium gellanilyticum]|uniref:Uncharacterized protein n=1 Tax=Roseimicrobium gellanilyticum TaxID=748857 RepID=A0A366HLJ2_9BACT|nr:hypothetical protein [Roseimicrobium gellanilyticum]RBP43734.1 hypothetical protein DES53_105133 [Roseimicrobium gellanilyticum]